MSDSGHSRWLVLLPPLVALVAWRQVPTGYFYSDDFQTLYDLANGTILRALFEPAFGHVNTTRNAVAGLIYFTVGPRAEVFYGLAWLVHAFNAWLIYRIAARLTGDRPVAAAVASVWAMSPLHRGTLEWFAAHGHGWIAALVLLMIDRLVTFEREDRRLGPLEAAAWGLGLLMMATSYGIGMGIAFSVPVAALIIGGRRVRPSALAVLGATLTGFTVAYVSLRAAFPPPAAPFGHLASPALADMLAHPWELAVLAVHLVLVAASGLALGPWFREAAYWGWPDVAGWLALAAVLLAAWHLGAPRRWLLGLLVAAFGCFPLVALGRIVVIPESPIGLALTPRYHYAPQACLALAVAVALAQVRRARPRALAIGVAAWALALGVGLALRPLRMDLHYFEWRAAERAVAQIRRQVREVPPGETAYLPNGSFEPILFLTNFQGPWKFPGLAGVFVIFLPGDTLEGRHVRFVATDEEAMLATRAGGRIATLLVPPSTPAAPNGPPLN